MLATKKEEFVEAFRKATGKDAASFKGKPKEFAGELNGQGREELRAQFRSAVKEYADRPKTDEENAQGLAALFEL